MTSKYSKFLVSPIPVQNTLSNIPILKSKQNNYPRWGVAPAEWCHKTNSGKNHEVPQFNECVLQCNDKTNFVDSAYDAFCQSGFEKWGINDANTSACRGKCNGKHTDLYPTTPVIKAWKVCVKYLFFKLCLYQWMCWNKHYVWMSKYQLIWNKFNKTLKFDVS